MQINELIAKVKVAKELIKDAQPELLAYCRNKELPLDERWEVWTELVEKEHQSWLVHNEVLEPLYERNVEGGCLSRYQTLDYNWFIEAVDDYKLNLSDIELTEKQIPVKEALMEKNLGSMVIDW